MPTPSEGGWKRKDAFEARPTFEIVQRMGGGKSTNTYRVHGAWLLGEDGC
jgi:hypothetical protein